MHCDALQSRDTYKEYTMSRSPTLFCHNKNTAIGFNYTVK